MPTRKTLKEEQSFQVPEIDHKNCPKDLIKWWNRTRRADMLAYRSMMEEVLGPVPKYMKIAGENRVWLWVLTLLHAVDLGLMIVVLMKVFG